MTTTSKGETSVEPALVLPFAIQPDLAATMDIQIPALAWQQLPHERFGRVYHLDGHAVAVEVTEGAGALNFFYTAPTAAIAARLQTLLRRSFPRQIGQLTLRAHPILRSLQEHYAGVIVMHTDAFEAVVLTILSQNRTGEIVRVVYPALAQYCGGVTPHTLAAVPVSELREVIRSAGPYKAPRLAETAARVLADGEDTFHRRVVDAPGEDAVRYLESFPGIAHKTAACVLVFSADTTATLPVDTHLFRVVDRLGLARHSGRNNQATRTALIRTLLGYGPDLAPAHFLFLLLGRDTCRDTSPACPRCFLQPHCDFARAGDVAVDTRAGESGDQASTPIPGAAPR